MWLGFPIELIFKKKNWINKLFWYYETLNNGP